MSHHWRAWFKALLERQSPSTHSLEQICTRRGGEPLQLRSIAQDQSLCLTSVPTQQKSVTLTDPLASMPVACSADASGSTSCDLCVALVSWLCRASPVHRGCNASADLAGSDAYKCSIYYVYHFSSLVSARLGMGV